MDVLYFFTVFLSGVLAGGLFMAQVGVLHAMRRLPAEVASRMHQTIGPGVDRFLPASDITATIIAIVILAKDAHFSKASPVLVAIGIAGLVAVGLISTFLNFPINRVVYRQAPRGLPEEEYVPLRERWAIYQTTRMVVGLATFGCFLAAALAQN